MMAPRRAPGVSEFLTALAAFPPPERLLDDLVTGALRPLGPISAAIWVGEPTALRLVAAPRMQPATVTSLAHIPFADDGPIVRSFLESEVIFDDAGLATERTTSSTPGTVGSVRRGRRAVHGLICLPIVSLGISIGVVAVCTDRPPRLTTLEIAQLDGISAALGLWLTHPDSGIASGEEPAPEAEPPTLTERQERVLALVLGGRSNSAIAAQLGYSVSTVKQDIQRAQRLLRTGSRSETAQRASALGLISDPLVP